MLDHAPYCTGDMSDEHAFLSFQLDLCEIRGILARMRDAIIHLIRELEPPASDPMQAERPQPSPDEVRALGHVLLDLAAVDPAVPANPIRRRHFRLPFLSE